MSFRYRTAELITALRQAARAALAPEPETRAMPCPFCGGEMALAEIHEDPVPGAPNKRLHSYECPACGRMAEELL